MDWAISHGYKDSDVTFSVIGDSHTIIPSSFDRKIVVYLSKSLSDLEDRHVSRTHSRIFKSSTVEIYERSDSTPARGIRHGVADEFAHMLLKHIRLVARAAICSKSCRPFPDLEKKIFQYIYSERCTFGITVWKDGYVRGSAVSSGVSLKDGLDETVTNTLRDIRFKPLSTQELEDARIEINISPDIWMPVTDLDLRSEIAPHFLASRCKVHGRERAHNFPAVTNIGYSGNTYDYYRKLAEKARIGKNQQILFETAPCFSFIENARLDSALQIRGGIPLVAEIRPSLKLLEDITESIVQNIDSDGFIQNRFQLSTSSKNYRMDILRMSFIYSALCESRDFTAKRHHDKSIRKLRNFIEKNISAHTMLQQALPEIYLARGDLFLGEKDSTFLRKSLSRDYQNVQIPAAIQIMKLKLLILNQEGRAVPRELSDYAGIIFREWRMHKDIDNFYLFSDIISILRQIKLDREYEEISTWLASKQHPDGSFSEKRVPTTRNMSKIIESCMTDTRLAPHMHRATAWVLRMLYTHDSMFHIPTDMRPCFNYCLRHDYWNRDVWLDGSAHLLTALTRKLYKENH